MTYEKMLSIIETTLQEQGYVTGLIYNYDHPTEVVVQKAHSEITTKEVIEALDGTIPAKFFTPRWISENGEIYIETNKFWQIGA